MLLYWSPGLPVVSSVACSWLWEQRELTESVTRKQNVWQIPCRRTRRMLVPQVRPSPGVERATVAWKQTLAEWVISVVRCRGGAEQQSAFTPFATVVFSQNGDHPLYWAQNGPVDDHWPLPVVTVVAVEEEGGVHFWNHVFWPFWLGCQLTWRRWGWSGWGAGSPAGWWHTGGSGRWRPWSECQSANKGGEGVEWSTSVVRHPPATRHETYLWSVEGTVSRVQDPLLPKLVQAVLQLLHKWVFFRTYWNFKDQKLLCCPTS